MKAFTVSLPEYSDYELIRRNGLWSGPGTLGYEQNLNKLVAAGRAKPTDPETILAELYSPYVDDFLHGLGGEVAFLCSERAMEGLSGRGLAGLRFGPVEIVKIATKRHGSSREPTGGGEPEDLIEKPSNKIGNVSVPRLYAVHVTGIVDVQTDKGGTSNARHMPAFSLPEGSEGTPDLWRPRVAQEVIGGWTFCSHRFKQTVEELGLTNIRFIPFVEFMQSYRERER